MKYASFIRMPKKIAEDAPMAAMLIKHDISKRKKKLLKESVRLMNPEVQMGIDGDDFIKERITIKIGFDAYRIPRIIKNKLNHKAPSPLH